MRTWLIIVSLSFIGISPCFAASKQAHHCAAPAYRQFDFWVGDWDAYDSSDSDKSVARNRVDIILDGCVVREFYRQNDGLVGRSFSIYDATNKVWHQTWVTNRGQLLVLEGGLKHGRMVLTGSTADKAGRRQMIKGIWMPIKGGVREIARQSSDGGNTWKPLFDVVFRPHHSDRTQ